MASQREISNEVNTRFWLMSQYKLGEALNPNDSADRRQARIWLDIYRDLLQQNSRGTLVLTHKHPSVAQNLNAAIAAYQIERATSEGDPRYTAARAARARAVDDATLWQELVMSRGPTTVGANGAETAPQQRPLDYILVGPMLAGALSGAYFADKRPVAGGVVGGVLGALVGAGLSRLGA